MTAVRLDVPVPALCITTRARGNSDRQDALVSSVAALEEVARRMGVTVAGAALLVVHERDREVVEVALPVDSLPAANPPPPVAAEVLVPGTLVEEADPGT